MKKVNKIVSLCLLMVITFAVFAFAGCNNEKPVENAAFSLVIGQTVTNVCAEKYATVASVLENKNLNKENTLGFYTDSNYQNEVDVSKKISEVKVVYTRMATLDKLTIAEGNVRAINKSIEGEVVIPYSFDGDDVTGIIESAFEKCYSVTEVYMPASIKTIADYAFDASNNITKIQLSSKLESIGKEAFTKTSIQDLYIPKTCTSIGERIVGGGYNILDSIVVEEGNSVYKSENNCLIKDDILILGCKNSVIPSSGVETIGKYAFSGIVYLNKNTNGATGITIPANIKTIEHNAFANSSTLVKVIIAEGSNLETIGEGAFAYSGVSTINLDVCTKLATINNKAFLKCVMSSITIPASVTTLGDEAFSGVSSLASVTFAEDIQLKKIGKLTFNGCYFSHISIPSSVEEIGDQAFYHCRNLTYISLGGDNSQLKKIGDSAFSGCCLLRSGDGSNPAIVFAASLEYIGKNAFAQCVSLDRVTFKDPEGWFKSSSASATNGESVDFSDIKVSAEELVKSNIYYKKTAA